MVKRLKVRRKRLSVDLSGIIRESVKETWPGECPPQGGRGDSNTKLSENSFRGGGLGWNLK